MSNPLKSVADLVAPPGDDDVPELPPRHEPVELPGQRGLAAALQGVQAPTERAVVLTALHRATTAAQRRLVVSGQGVAVVVRVPSPAWVRPVVAALMSHAQWDKTVSGLPTSKLRADADLDASVAAHLGAGGRVLGVSTDPQRFLPAALVAAADVSVTLAAPGHAAVAAVVAAVLGRRAPRRVPPAVAAGLDLPDLVAAIRPGSTPARCVERLLAASASKAVVDAAVATAPLLQDLHGYGAAMDWCVDLVRELDAWRAGTAPFPEAPRCVLAGPPGTGKTLLVRSLARTTNLPMVATSVAAWFADSPGQLDSVIKAAADVFARAAAMAPAVVLLDELDAIPNRLTMSPRGRDWWVPVVTAILLMLDSAVSGATRGLVIVGATNHAGDLDPALVRPGRLERIIQVPPPRTAAERAAILRGHLARDLPADADLSAVATATPRFTGAELEAVARGARRRARAEGRPMAVADLLAAAMPEDGRPEPVRQRLAVHEAGHATVAGAVGIEVASMALVAAGSAGGYTEVRALRPDAVTRAEAEAYATMLLAGAAAEDVILGARSTAAGGGDASDLGVATGLLRDLRTRYGLTGRIVHTAPRGGEPEGPMPAALAEDVEKDMRRLLAVARGIVAGRRAAVLALADALVRERVLDGAAIAAILAAHPPNQSPREAPRREADRTPPVGGSATARPRSQPET